MKIIINTNAIIFFALALLNPILVGMEHFKSVAIGASPCKFSPDGKYVLAYGEKNVAVYDTQRVIKKGVLENTADWYLPTHANLFTFSPQETYITFGSHIWTVTDLKEHLPKILKSRDIKVWNGQETMFVSFPILLSQPNMLHIHDAITGQVKQQIDFGPYGIPLTYSMSNDGSLLAFIYKPNITFMLNRPVYERKKAAIFDLQNDNGPTIVNNAMNLVFSPDNDHAIIALYGNQLLIIGNKLRPYVTHKIFDLPIHLECFFMRMNRLNCIISNNCMPKEYWTITQNEDAFSLKQHTPPKNTDQSNTGDTHTVSVFNAKSNDESLKPNSLYLKRLYKTKKRKTKHLLKSKYALAAQGIQFAGSHDQLLLVPCPAYTALFLFSLPKGRKLAKLSYKEFTLSSDKHSFIIEGVDGKKTLYAVSSCIDILSHRNDSYFSLLPLALRAYVRNFKT